MSTAHTRTQFVNDVAAKITSTRERNGYAPAGAGAIRKWRQQAEAQFDTAKRWRGRGAAYGECVDAMADRLVTGQPVIPRSLHSTERA